ncbi:MULTISPECIES: FxLYD domain-containing protein [Spirulina sp. CCY15215]|uniref:FxLYD domain-containing protein n=1 Tax=Spirulina sp. CCY15215 TaxID=2767591 RepID=UPI0019502A36|nr:FxLYD domain-containing protein [Spirulina major]
MKFRNLAIAAIAILLWVASFAIAPESLALTQVKLNNLNYRECPTELAEGMMASGSSQKVNCFLITGTAVNTSNKYVVDADVFGRIYDKDGNNVMQNRSRVGTIPSIPPGESEFEIRISVAANQPTPLQLKQFKASGFSSRVRPYYYDDFKL